MRVGITWGTRRACRCAGGQHGSVQLIGFKNRYKKRTEKRKLKTFTSGPAWDQLGILWLNLSNGGTGTVQWWNLPDGGTYSQTETAQRRVATVPFLVFRIQAVERDPGHREGKRCKGERDVNKTADAIGMPWPP